eukprot:IDg15056t1
MRRSNSPLWQSRKVWKNSPLDEQGNGTVLEDVGVLYSKMAASVLRTAFSAKHCLCNYTVV